MAGNVLEAKLPFTSHLSARIKRRNIEKPEEIKAKKYGKSLREIVKQ